MDTTEVSPELGEYRNAEITASNVVLEWIPVEGNQSITVKTHTLPDGTDEQTEVAGSEDDLAAPGGPVLPLPLGVLAVLIGGGLSNTCGPGCMPRLLRVTNPEDVRHSAFRRGSRDTS